MAILPGSKENSRESSLRYDLGSESNSVCCCIVPVINEASGASACIRDFQLPQVTVRQFALRPACTVRTWHPESARREPLAPRRWFWPTADQCAGARLLSIPVEARFSMRPFALRHRGLASRPIPVTASTFPVYIFKTIPRSDPARSAPHSRPHSVFCDLVGHDPHAEPVA